MILVFTKVTCRNFSYVLATIIQYCQQKKVLYIFVGMFFLGVAHPQSFLNSHLQKNPKWMPRQCSLFETQLLLFKSTKSMTLMMMSHMSTE